MKSLDDACLRVAITGTGTGSRKLGESNTVMLTQFTKHRLEHTCNNAYILDHTTGQYRNGFGRPYCSTGDPEVHGTACRSLEFHGCTHGCCGRRRLEQHLGKAVVALERRKIHLRSFGVWGSEL